MQSTPPVACLLLSALLTSCVASFACCSVYGCACVCIANSVAAVQVRRMPLPPPVLLMYRVSAVGAQQGSGRTGGKRIKGDRRRGALCRRGTQQTSGEKLGLGFAPCRDDLFAVCLAMTRDEESRGGCRVQGEGDGRGAQSGTEQTDWSRGMLQRGGFCCFSAGSHCAVKAVVHIGGRVGRALVAARGRRPQAPCVISQICFKPSIPCHLLQLLGLS